MKQCTALWTACCLSLLLASCVATEATRDAHFSAIFGRPLRTRKPLYLYQLNAMRNGDPERHSVSVSKMIMEDEAKEVIAILPAGHRVTFEKLRKGPRGSRRLVGFTVYKNVKYPIIYLLGFSGGKEGWERCMETFQQ